MQKFKPKPSVSNNKNFLRLLTVILFIAFGLYLLGNSFAATGCSGITVQPGDNIQSIVSNAPENATICVSGGVHRITSSIYLKSGQTLQGKTETTSANPAILTATKQVTASSDGQYWAVNGNSHNLTTMGIMEGNSTNGKCREIALGDPNEFLDSQGRGACVYLDQVVLDSTPMWQVLSKQGLSNGSNRFYWDYTTNKIYINSNPSGKKLEVSVFGSGPIVQTDSSAPSVTVSDLIIEGSGYKWRALNLRGDDSLVTNSEIRNNAAGGMFIGSNRSKAEGNYIHHNGLYGWNASGIGVTNQAFINNEVSFNNSAGNDWNYSAGSSKVNHQLNFIMRGNYSHDNYGSGFWADADNINMLIEDNRIEDNLSHGIHYEINRSATIRNNDIRNNGLGHFIKKNAQGAGIFISSSEDVEVYGNLLVGNNAGITGVTHENRAHKTLNANIHNNEVIQDLGDSKAAGLVENDATYNGYTTQSNNVWHNNTYCLQNKSQGSHFLWTLNGTASAFVKLADWQSSAQGAGSLYYGLQDCPIDTSASTPTDPTPTPVTQEPYASRIPIPGRVETEHFDTGGEDVSYHDLDPENRGSAGFRGSEGVDVNSTTDTSSQHTLGFVQTGEWTEYSVTVAQDANYQLDARVASIQDGGRFHVEIDDQDVSGAIVVPNTGSYETYQTVSVNDVPLTSGQHILRLKIDASGANGFVGDINWLSFAEEPSQTPTPEPGVCDGFNVADVNCDTKVDIFDLSKLLSKYNTQATTREDVNGDGNVDIFDLSILLSNFGA